MAFASSLIFALTVLAGACAATPSPAVAQTAASPPASSSPPSSSAAASPIRAAAASPVYRSAPLAASAREPASARAGRLAGLTAWQRDLLAVVSEMATAMGRVPPVPESRLHDVARDLALAVRDKQAPPSDVVRFVSNQHGVIETDPAIFTLVGPLDPAGMQEHYRRSLGDVLRREQWNRVGIGAHTRGDETAVVLTLWQQQVEIQPVPRELPLQGRAPLVGRLGAGLRSAQVVVTLPGGSVRVLPVTASGDTIKAELRCAGDRGPHQIEILAVGAGGPTVLGNFPVFCGVPAPVTTLASEVARGAAVTDPTRAARDIAGLINEARAKARLRPLIWDQRLADIARAHSQDMATGGFVAHVSPRTGDAVARIKRAGLAFALIAENVGQEAGVSQIHRGFMASPGHRANVLNPRLARVGIGVAIAPGAATSLVVTELFAGD